MSVLKSIGPKLHEFVWDTLGEEQVHDLGGEFLQTPYKTSNPHFDDVDDVVHGSDLFTAWLWQDYVHEGKTMLEHFQASEPALSKEQALQLDQMIRTGFMSAFRLGEVRPGNIELEDLRSGTRYHVREYSLASQVHSGQFIIARLCQQGDHWEISMPDGSMFPFTMGDETMLKNAVEKLPERVTMQHTTGYALLRRDLGLDDSYKPDLNKPRPQLPKKEAAAGLQQAMAETGVDRYIAPTIIMQLLDEEFAAKDMPPFPPAGVRVLLGLAGDNEQLEKLMGVAMDYWNAHVSKRKLKKPHVPDVVVNEFDPNGWVEKANTAHEFLIVQDSPAASKVYEDMFAYMLKERMVTPSLYRLITNAAVAELGQGHLLFGEHLLETAQALCPDYDFAWHQQELLENGHYAFAGLKEQGEDGPEGLLEKLKQAQERLGPSPEIIKTYTDKKLLQAFAERGADTDREAFAQLASQYDEAYDVAEELTSNNAKDVDAVYTLVCEVQERWAPNVVWVDTLHRLMEAYDDSMFDADGQDSKDYAAMLDSLNRFHHALDTASDSVVHKWMTDSREYADHRQNIVFASLQIARAKPKQPALSHAAAALCALAQKRTGDPIFTVPSLLENMSKTDEKAVKKQFSDLAKLLPNDSASFQILGDQLEVQKQYTRAVLAFEHAIAALDRCRSKKLWQDPPYSYETLAESYEYIGASLYDCYTALGRMGDAAKLTKKLTALQSDTRLEHNKTADALQKIDEKLVAKEAGQDNPILDYIRWFETLDIDLSGGDGNETVLTGYSGGEKIGRNDPCPCGKLRPNGLPMKYKNCCGA
ncbi:hypothetical protein IPP75_05745 [Candidatus Saccharibacteria bacterium]|nr:MAG: hypothetical protein IPP75_05745 [Candidatus Saccharibacteria bacterium]